ncbi:tail terminator protein [Corynebacterium phage CL31]|nr:tail terminator protein [Corynebacterium phage CL31]
MSWWLQQDAPTMLRTKIQQGIGDDGSKVKAELPDGWTPRDGPVITVVSDGGQRAAVGTDRELVRVTVRAGALVPARKIMTEIDSYLTTPGIHLLGFSISKTQGTPIIAGPDSLVGGYFASRVFSVGTTRKKV